jgi:hypothetical protein
MSNWLKYFIFDTNYVSTATALTFSVLVSLNYGHRFTVAVMTVGASMQGEWNA